MAYHRAEVVELCAGLPAGAAKIGRPASSFAGSQGSPGAITSTSPSSSLVFAEEQNYTGLGLSAPSCLSSELHFPALPSISPARIKVPPSDCPWGALTTSGTVSAREPLLEDIAHNRAGRGPVAVAHQGGLMNRDFTDFKPCKAGCRPMPLLTRKERQLFRKLQELEKTQSKPPGFKKKSRPPPAPSRQEQQHLHALLDEAFLHQPEFPEEKEQNFLKDSLRDDPFAQTVQDQTERPRKNEQLLLESGLRDDVQAQAAQDTVRPRNTAQASRNVSQSHRQATAAATALGIREFTRPVSAPPLSKLRNFDPLSVETVSPDNRSAHSIPNTGSGQHITFSRGRPISKVQLTARIFSIEHKKKRFQSRAYRGQKCAANQSQSYRRLR